MAPVKKRWLVLAAGMAVNLFQGIAYASSVFKEPLMEHLGGTHTDWSVAFSLSFAFLPAGTIIAGRIADRYGPRSMVACGGLLFSLGLFLAGFAQELIHLYLTFGVMLSLGSGAAYGSIVGVSVKWFPDRPGLASGMVVSALGAGPIVLAPLAKYLIGVPELGVTGMFKVLGGLCLVVMLGAAFFVTAPPKDFQVEPRGQKQKDEKCGPHSSDGLTWSEMIRTARFWGFYFLYTAGTFSGLMVLSVAFPIATEVTNLAPIAAIGLISLFSVFNAFGRFFWGSISDKIGRMNSLIILFAVMAIVMFFLPLSASEYLTITISFILLGLCYGGYLGVFPSICSDTFGSTHMTTNYGILFSAFSLAALIGPSVMGTIRDATDGYSLGFYTAAGVCVCGLLVALVMIHGQLRPSNCKK